MTVWSLTVRFKEEQFNRRFREFQMHGLRISLNQWNSKEYYCKNFLSCKKSNMTNLMVDFALMLPASHSRLWKSKIHCSTNSHVLPTKEKKKYFKMYIHTHMLKIKYRSDRDRNPTR